MMRIVPTFIVIAVMLGACSQPIVISAPNVVLPFENTDEVKTGTRSDLSFIPPTDPRYSENGAPRAGEVTGESRAGPPWLVGAGRSYAPLPGGRP
jgi:hypothetical protein